MRRWFLTVVTLCCGTLLFGCGNISSATNRAATPGVLASSTATPPNHVVVSLVIASPSPTASSTPTSSPTPSTTPVAGAVQGTVLLEDGRCCVGGKAGTDVQIDAAFSATSTDGNVVEMRVNDRGGCAKDGDLDQIAWEPFVATKTFTFESIPINWVGFYVSAQFRDDKGRVSPVVCDDISVEGMP